MVTESPRERPEFWPRQLVKKWLNLRHTGNLRFERDTDMDARSNSEENSDSEENGDEFDLDMSKLHANLNFNAIEVDPSSKPLSLLRGQSETLRQQFVDGHEFRVAVHSWNVAGKPPPQDLDLEEWINDAQSADIYVFGFQEIVPLNANNVLCVEDREPAARWESKIRDYLNNKDLRQESDPFQSRSAPSSTRFEDTGIPVSQVSEADKLLGQCVSGRNVEKIFLATEGNFLKYEETLPAQFEEWTLDRTSGTEKILEQPLAVTNSDLATLDLREAALVDGSLSEKANLAAPMLSSTGAVGYPPNEVRRKYSCVASKQMVGIFITVWVRSQLWRHVHNVKVSAVGLGLMRYLGNKTVGETSYLPSPGEWPGDPLCCSWHCERLLLSHRWLIQPPTSVWDSSNGCCRTSLLQGSVSVSMCLHHTSFCFVCSHLTSGNKDGDQLRRNADVGEILRRTKFPRLVKLFGVELPEVILAHDRVIWLGDLNYRLALPDKEIWRLVSCSDWESLLRKDQLKLEQGEGRVFKDWQEGPIHFSPTYKYKEGTDHFSGETSSTGEKRRSPAWCDRILWYGKGMKQVAYTRGSLKLSDHRSVSATFAAEVEIISHRKLKQACIYPNKIINQLEPEKEKTGTIKNEVSVRRSQRFRKLARANSFVYPEFAFSSARAWRGDAPRVGGLFRAQKCGHTGNSPKSFVFV